MATSSRDFTLHPAGSCSLLTLLIAPWLSARLPNRNTVIFPVGGIDLINDQDEWRNVRKRNKKTSFRWIGKTEFTILPPIPTSDEASGSTPEFPPMPTMLDGSLEHREKVPCYGRRDH